MGNKKKLINDLLSCIDGGVEVASSYLGLSVSAFNDRRYENKGTRFFSGDELMALQNLSKTALVADYFARAVNCIVIKKPDVAKAGSYDLFESMLSIGTARGKYENYLANAISDGVITDEEESILNRLCESIVKNRLKAHIETIKSHKQKVDR
ncbi:MULTISPECIES: YmfL family putative regulatory protein [unclassified Gilliamella]|uniref:YmfL family putative regulatory protein n=1 Tax=unclassified Gilliamella TaxID=2685620 RepID=UPI00226AA4D5|nr:MULTISPECIES: YmfL family putative regulatory protein [unclassified Gilliamella]MCX8574551.1 hypothetical protein [Gilliamella sp. B3831]MCX8576782.1 hypothetical protein [Gilliamella sp. B3815]MCX8589236.1 hypothetical protein [Gilliamella sp. B3812]MCX8603810.1 hypothetical protein [Gilliamella sp. B3823]MCX8606690.1 hypothetical protein [Gilliamella sp. B3825]